MQTLTNAPFIKYIKMPYKEQLTKLTNKDLQNFLNCSYNTAKKYLDDMLQYYDPPANTLCYAHYLDYFAIPLNTIKNKK